MKLLIVTDTYWPETTATGMLITNLAEFLAGRGHQVSVLGIGITSARESDRTAPGVETHAGVHIRRVPLLVGGRAKLTRIGRAVNFLGFHAMGGIRLARTARRFDAIITLDAPPLAGMDAVVVRGLLARRTRHVCWSMDLVPDKHFELGTWSRRNPLARLLHFLSLEPYRRADLVVALGECMKRRLAAHGVPEDRIRVIGVWAPHELDRPASPQCSHFRARHGLDGKFVVMYAGYAGKAHPVQAIADAMRRLREDPRIMFVFVGGGSRMVALERTARGENVNALFVPFMPPSRMPDVLAAGDVQLVTLDESVVGTCVPSKLYAAMAAARPAIFAGPVGSDTARHIRESDCGSVVAQSDGEGLVETIRSLADDPAECRRLGGNARSAYLDRHAAAGHLARWENVLTTLVGSETDPPSHQPGAEATAH